MRLTALSVAMATFLALITPLRSARGAQSSDPPHPEPPLTRKGSGASARQVWPIPLPKAAVLPAALNYRLWNGVPLTDIAVNGAAIQHFVIASGANADLLSPDAAAKLGIASEGPSVRVDLFDRSSDAPQTTVKGLRIGLLTLEGLPFALLDPLQLLSRTPRPDAPEGWLGAPFLAAFTVTIDPSSHSITLERPDVKLPVSTDAISVPLVVKDGRPFVSVQAPGARAFLALVDTGTAGSLIPSAVGAKLKLKPVDTGSVTSPDGAVARAALLRVPLLKVGSANVTNVLAACLAADAPLAFNKEMGALGMDFFNRYRVTLSLVHKRMVLSPLQTPGTP